VTDSPTAAPPALTPCQQTPAERSPDDRPEIALPRHTQRLILRPRVELDGQVIGDLLVRGGQVADRQAEIGWALHPDFQGHGYATEAARELINLSFTDLRMHRVWAQLDPRNTASAKLCERLGMVREAQLRESRWAKGEWTDSAVYAILRSEWSG